IIQDYALKDHDETQNRIHLHFFENPVEVLGQDGKVSGLRTERTELDGTGNVRGTGEHNEWPVQAVYRAVGYLSEHVAKLPFDEQAGVIPNEAGRVTSDDGSHFDSTYVTGWIKRGPVGLIGSTKGDANETVACLTEDFEAGRLPEPENASEDAILEFLDAKQHPYTTWDGWYRLDARERELGEDQGRERVKVVER